MAKRSPDFLTTAGIYFFFPLFICFFIAGVIFPAIILPSGILWPGLGGYFLPDLCGIRFSFYRLHVPLRSGEGEAGVVFLGSGLSRLHLALGVP
jgi:hypothetical protein